MTRLTDQKLKRLKLLIRAIKVENKKQLEKWGIQTRTPFEWLAYITEEIGELAKAISEEYYRDGSKEEVFKEAIQAATLILKIAEIYYPNDIRIIVHEKGKEK